MAACRDDLGHASLGDDDQAQPQVGGRQITACTFRPFDETDTLALEVFVESRIKVFFRLVESIKIKVVQV